MKKFLVTAIILGAGVLAVPSIEARSAAGVSSAAKPQIHIQIGRNYRRGYYRRERSFVTTRIVHYGFRTYRETIRTMYLPNGMVRTEIIDRVRIY